MVKKVLKTAREAAELLNELNHFHDASIKQIYFLKKRSLDKNTGDLVYPFAEISDDVGQKPEFRIQ